MKIDTPIVEMTDIYHTIFDSARIAIAAIDLEGKFVLVNRAWSNILGFSATKATKMSYLDITPEDDHESAKNSFESLKQKEVNSIAIRRKYLTSAGKKIWVDLYVSPLFDAGGEVNGLLGVFVNVDKEVRYYHKMDLLNEFLQNLREEMMKDANTISILNEELKTAYAKMEALARTDTLTGLYNRRVLNEILEREIPRAMRNGTNCAVAIADIDDFKHVNDTYGHDCGDVVLQEMAAILRTAIRGTDYVGRWGGEEFLFVLPETDICGAEVVMNRVLEDVRKICVSYGPHNINPRLSIGLCFRVGDMGIEDTLVEADKSLYIAKSKGKDQVCYNDICTSIR